MQHHTLTDLLPVLRQRRSLPPNQELAVYEEVEFETTVRFEPLTPGKCLKECELQSGDILVFHLRWPASEVERLTVRELVFWANRYIAFRKK